MTTKDERLQVLRMVQDGRISPEEAAKLLEAVEPKAAAELDAKQVKIIVTDIHNQRKKINIALPLGLVEWGLRFVPALVWERQGGEQRVSPGELLDLIRLGARGKIVDIDDAQGRQVEIWVE
ncbi:MAG: hypothetical protein AB1492_06850 [Bacillota bacterium]